MLHWRIYTEYRSNQNQNEKTVATFVSNSSQVSSEVRLKRQTIIFFEIWVCQKEAIRSYVLGERHHAVKQEFNSKLTLTVSDHHC